MCLVERVGGTAFRETNICQVALISKVILAAVVFELVIDLYGGSASHSYIAKRAKNRTEKWRFGAEFWKFFGWAAGWRGW